jgi:hypothetical protein
MKKNALRDSNLNAKEITYAPTALNLYKQKKAQFARFKTRPNCYRVNKDGWGILKTF